MSAPDQHDDSQTTVEAQELAPTSESTIVHRIPTDDDHAAQEQRTESGAKPVAIDKDDAVEHGLSGDTRPEPADTTEARSDDQTLVPSGQGDTKPLAKDTEETPIPISTEETSREDTGMNLQTAQLSLDSKQENRTNDVQQEDPFRNKPGVRSPSPPPLPPKDDRFIAAIADTPSDQKQSSDQDYDEKHPPAEDDTIPDTSAAGEEALVGDRSEIQSIMDQFTEGSGQGQDVSMSPRLEMGQPSFQPPPRTSSLEPLRTRNLSSPSSPLHTTTSKDGYSFSPASVRAPSIAGGASTTSLQRTLSTESGTAGSPHPSNASMFQPPPPSPDPEPALPFDFHRFLEQLRHKSADPVARFLRSFLLEFGRKQWMVHEQVKIIGDFLEFISKKMSQCEVWRTVSDAEFDNAREGMEKLVMNRLYSQTFSPAIPPPEATPLAKNRRKQNHATDTSGPGRRGQHQEDVERDDVIAQKIRIYGWIREEHLDLGEITGKGRNFLRLAQQELLRINSYRAPRDKVICILNCCKVIFGFLKNSKGDQSADAFVPLLIYTVLRANPEHLVSNVQYITRFRNQDKLGGEAGYYISSLMGVVTFVENLDRTNLTITDDEFEKNVEEAVSAIAEGHKKEEEEESSKQQTKTAEAAAAGAQSSVLGASPQKLQLQVSEKSTLSRPEITPRNSLDVDRASPRRNPSTRLISNPGSPEKVSAINASGTTSSGGGTANSDEDENAAMTGLLRTIQKPLSTIGRIFSDEGSRHPKPSESASGSSTPGLAAAAAGIGTTRQTQARGSARDVMSSIDARHPGLQPALTPQPAANHGRRLSPAPRLPEQNRSEDGSAARKDGSPASQTRQRGSGGVERARSAESRTSLDASQDNNNGGERGDGGGKRGRGSRENSSGREDAAAAAARQASAEVAEVQRVRAQEHRVVVETLQGMFPDLDKEVISDVVRMKEGRVGMAVDACLALSN